MTDFPPCSGEGFLPQLRAKLGQLKKGKPLTDRESLDEVIERMQTVFGPYTCHHLGQLAELYGDYGEHEEFLLASLPDTMRDGVRARIARVFTNVLSAAPRAEGGAPEGGEEGGLEASVEYEYADAGITPLELGQYLDLALQTGTRRLVTILKAAQRIRPEHQETLMKLIARHLEECASIGSHPVNILRNPPTVLAIPQVQDIVRHMLRQHVYDALQREGADAWKGDPNEHRRYLERIPQLARRHMEALLQKSGAARSDIHDRLIEDVVRQYGRYAAYEPPEELVTSLTIDGESHHVPSLRQRMAVVQGLDDKRILVDFDTGDGKYLTAVLLWIEMNRRRAAEGLPPGRMVYVSPPNVIPDLRNRVNPLPNVRATHEPYFTHNHPTTGAITSAVRSRRSGAAGTTSEPGPMEQQLDRDIVFVSHTMLGKERDGAPVVRHIIESAREHLALMLAVDESQVFNGGDLRYRELARLILGLTDVREQGVIAELSATPITNHLSDYHRTFSILHMPPRQLREACEERTSKKRRRMDTDLLYAASQRHHFRVDRPTDILEHVEEFPWTMSGREHEHCRTLINDASLGFAEKQAAVVLAELHPQLSSGDPTMPCSLLDAVNDLVTRLLEGTIDDGRGACDTVLISETFLSDWILRHPAYLESYEEAARTFAQMLEERLRRLEARRRRDCADGAGFKPIRFHVIHGDVLPRARREAAISDAFDSRRTGNTQSVLLVFGDCVNIGINLSCIKAVIELESYRTQPPREQLLGRVNREGNAARYFIMRGPGLLGTFKDHADLNAGPILRFRRGQGGSSAQFRRMERENDETPQSIGGTVHLGTHIAEHLTPQCRKLAAAQGWAQNCGFRKYRNKWMSDEEERRKWLDLHVYDRDGPEVLTVPEHARFAAGLLERLRADGLIPGGDVLDLHSHALALLRALRGAGIRHWNMDHMVLHQSIGAEGVRLMMEENLPHDDVRWREGVLNNLGSVFGPGERFDAIVLSDGFQHSRPLNTRMDALDPAAKCDAMMGNERIQILTQAWRALREGGALITLLPWYALQKEEGDAFLRMQEFLGFDVLRKYSGFWKSTDNPTGDCSRIFAVVGRKMGYGSDGTYADMLRTFLPEQSVASFTLTHIDKWESGARRGAARRLCGAPLLQHPFLHRDFECCGNGTRGESFSFVHKPEIRAAQLERLGAVRNAVQTLRVLARGHGGLHRLDSGTVASLQERGILLLPPHRDIGKTAVKIRLNVGADGLAQYEQRILPFDGRWNGIVREPIPPLVARPKGKNGKRRA